MSKQNKSGREVRKPKQEQNKKQHGQTPTPTGPAVGSMGKTAK